MAENVITTATNGTSPTVDYTPTVTPSQTFEELQAELDRLKTENDKLKRAQSNASADASKYKKALEDRMTEQEKAANATKELIEQLKADNANLLRNQTFAEYTSGFMGIGFDADMAKKAAEATLNVGSDFSALTTTIKEFIEAHDKAVNAEALRNTPRPGVGATAPTVTKAAFDKMNYAERLKVFNEQPDLYKTLIQQE